MKAKQQLVIINLQKVSNGYLVVDKFEEKVSTKIKIPKTILNQPKPIEVKQPEIKPHPQPKQQHPPQQIPSNTIQYQPPKPIWNPPPPPQQITQEQNNINQHKMMFQAPIPPQQIPQQYVPQTPQIQQPQLSSPQQQIITQQPQNINQPLENQKQEQKRVLQKYQLIIPSCANWYSPDNIHEIEKKQFPEFFTGQHISKTPELYKKYRNFIINLYRNQPNTYLTTIACRKVLAGDACTITRIHGFLQYWGLINYSVDPDSCPNKVLPQISVTKNLYRQLQLNAKDELDEKLDLNANEISLVNTIKAFTKKYRPICTFCGIICGLQWYEEKDKKQDDASSKVNNNDNETQQDNEIQSKLSLCVKCYSNNSFPNNMVSEDFEQLNLEQKFNQIHLLSKEPKQSLNDSEVGFVVSIFQENPETNWEKVTTLLNQTFKSNYSEEDVILHFLQYPIELFVELDKVLDSKECLDKLKLSDLAQKIPFEEPHIFDENQNLVSFHLSIFRKLLNKFVKRQEPKEEEPKIENKKAEIEIEQQNEEAKRVIQMRDESLENAKQLQLKEEEKLHSHINLLISFQMEKLEHKLTFLEEYEKLILYEKQQLEICQKQTLAERLQILQQKLQLYQDNSQ